MASSFSSSSLVQQKYQVFLSFRGEDTRRNFTSHLLAALKRKGIYTFFDDQLVRGEEISVALFTAIEKSKISIIVLSENYASSSWCLDELSKILECKEKNQQKVIPIFYYVDPSDIRNLRGTFAEAFAEHDKKRPDKVERWSAALRKIGSLSGHHLDANKDGPESTVVEKIAKEISKDLMNKSLYDTKGLVGIDSRIQRIKSLLRINSVDVRIIGICGIGGIGKTTIAEVVFYQFYDEFEGYCFLNVKDELNRGGEVHFLKELLSKVLEDENLNIYTSSLPASILDRLHQKKVFIVLDDVNNLEKLDLLRKKHYFGSGSRIIIISRENWVPGHVDETYEVEGLIDDDALQLFSEHAFKQNHPKEDFMELSKKVVDYAKGLPLALKVVGSTLNGRSKSYWEDYLSRLKEILDPKIDDVLRISYDGLVDDEVKDIFLDIAFFFRGEDKDYVTKILGGCYSYIVFGINVLIDKSLITISINKLKMHDLLQQMAWNIVRQESKRPDKRSRLRTPEDIYHVLKNNMDAETVEGIFLDMSKIKKIYLRSTVFSRMYNLRLLNFYYSGLERERKVYLLQHVLEYLPDSLCYLRWDDYPSKSLPLNFCPDNLVELNLYGSHVEQLWQGTQNLVNLKWLNLSESEHLIELPDLSQATNLEEMRLWRCTSLVKVPESIRYLNNLIELDLRETAIEEVPSSIGCLSKLENLGLDDCRRLERLPSSICKLKTLIPHLYLRGCLKLKSFPEILEPIECLNLLNLERTSIEELPSSIEHLVGLEYLELQYCEKLRNLTSSITKLKSLRRLDLSYCKRLQSLPELPPNLKDLDATSCTSLEAVSSSFTIPHITKESEPTFIFSGCVKLDQNAISHILVETRLWIQHLETLDLKLYDKLSQRNPKVKLTLCLPGSEIPKWFSYQSEGSSVTAQLAGFAQCTIVGYALCAVVALEDYEEGQYFYVEYKVKRDNRKWSNCYVVYSSNKSVDSDNVFLLCESRVPFHSNEISFEFSVSYMDSPAQTCGKVKKCGFHLLYAQNDPTINQRQHDKAKEEPQPKRLKWNSEC